MMKMMKLAAGLTCAAAMSACATSDVVSRDAPYNNATQPAISFAQPDVLTDPQVKTVSAGTHARALTILPDVIMGQINVARINVSVPTALSVSEANRYYPTADIVWRGDPIGNRHAQVSRILHDGLAAGTSGFSGPMAVVLDVELERFHSVTEKARYTVGGVHNIVFSLVLRDAQSGEVVGKRHRISTSLEAFGGQQAVAAENRGLTQKVRVTGHLAEVIRQEMTKPETYEAAPASFHARLASL